MKSGRLKQFAMIGLAITFAASRASAQALNSGAQPIALNANLSESLTLNLSANAVNFTLTGGSATNAGSTNITATTAWVLKPGRTAVGVYAYFANGAAALTDGAGNNIPSSAFKISDNGGASTALTNTVAFGGANAGWQMANVAITGTNKNGNRTDVMAFNIDLSGGTLPQLPAATYTGTLNIQAQATP
jgi:lipopolysaccharide export system protein LptA